MIFSRDELIGVYFALQRSLRAGDHWMTVDQGPVFKKLNNFLTYASRSMAEKFAADNNNLLHSYQVMPVRPFAKLAGALLTEPNIPLVIDTSHYLLIHNQYVMNTKNLEYLQENLKYLGFGDGLNEKLESAVKAMSPEFTLRHQIPHYNNVADYQLSFRKSDNSEMYFLNKMDASIQSDIKIHHGNHSGVDSKELEERMKIYASPRDPGNAQVAADGKPVQEHRFNIGEDLKALAEIPDGRVIAERLAARYMEPADFKAGSQVWQGAEKVLDEHRISQTFYLNNGRGVTAKEAFNLLEGRSVNKDLINKEGQKYNAWMQLDFQNKDAAGLHKVKQFYPGYGFTLEKELAKMPLSELADPAQKAELEKSLKRGNLHAVTVETADGSRKQLIAADPANRTINRYYTNGKPIEPEGRKQDQSRQAGKEQQTEEKNQQKNQPARKARSVKM